MKIHWKNGKNFRADYILFQHFSKINYADYIGQYDNFSLGRKKRKKDYVSLGLAFDIETTSIMIDNEKTAFVYHWQIGIENDCFYGRELKEVVQVFDKLSDMFYPRRVICWVHNFAYEYGFLIEYMQFKNIFATAKHKPIYAEYKNIEFRCSYAFSNMSLALLSDTYTHTKKGVGDLDYNVIRYPNTQLTLKEKLYCYKDVKILTEYWYNHIYSTYIKGQKRKWLPLTNTSKVRNDMRSRIPNFYEYKKVLATIYPTQDLYNLLRKIFYGGIVRANADYFSQELFDVASRDRTSSYPAVMLEYLYPMAPFRKINITERDKYSDDDYAKIIHVVFKDIECIAPVSIIPVDKAKVSKDRVLDNGRLYKASWLDIYCTELDLQTWKKFYKGKLKYLEVWVSKKYHLPKFIIESVVSYYVNKKKLKGVKGKEELYMKNKNMLNSTYGLCVQKHNDTEVIFNFEKMEWEENDLEYKQGKSEFLAYQWGVWVTAYARYELNRAVYGVWQNDLKNNMSDDSIVYMDTDSCKYRYRNGLHEHIFTELDNDIKEKTIKACEYYNIDYNDIIEIGTWDLETYDKKTKKTTYDSFITLGSKRYLHNGEPTISGLPKQGFFNYCKIHNVTPQEAFTCGTVFPPNEINKTAMQYFNNQKQHIIENAGQAFITPKNFIFALPVGFKLDVGKEYKSFILKYAMQTAERGNVFNE